MGGKSRKSGGVSKSLIERLRKGNNKSDNCGTPKQPGGKGFGIVSKDDGKKSD